MVNNAGPMFNKCARQCNVVEEFKSSKYNGVYDYETVRPLGCPECLQNDYNDEMMILTAVPRLVPLSLVIVIVKVVVRVIVVFSVIVIAVDNLLCNNWERVLLYLFPAIIEIGTGLCQDWFLYHLLPVNDDILRKLPPYG